MSRAVEPSVTFCGKEGQWSERALIFAKKKTEQAIQNLPRSGAGSGGRTRTVSLPLDFESSTSANSIIPAAIAHSNGIVPYFHHKIKFFSEKRFTALLL